MPHFRQYLPRILLVLLIIMTSITAIPLVYMAYIYHQYTVNNPPRPPGDPDIGFGLLLLAAMLNIPTLLLWVGYFVWWKICKRVSKSSAASIAPDGS